MGRVFIAVLRSGKGWTGLSNFPIELRLVQLAVYPSRRQQLLVRATLDDPASIHHQDQIRRQDRGQAMGDDDACPACHDALQCLLDQ